MDSPGGCLRKKLDIHWGLSSSSKPNANFVSVITTWDQFFPGQLWTGAKARTAADNISQQRVGRHGEKFFLANLMDACQASVCEEPRDKVYASLGIAHDCEDGTFPVDYAKPLFELYEDVIHFHLKSPGGSQTAIQFSQLVQRLLGGSEAMQLDLKQVNPDINLLSNSYHRSEVEFEATHSTLTLLGPSYDEFVTYPEATRKWNRAISTYSWDVEKSLKDMFLEQLRKNNEVLMAMIHDLDPLRPHRMGVLEPFWDGTPALDELDITDKFAIWSPSKINLDSFAEETYSLEDEPRLFSTRDGVIGLMPPRARLGDILLRFHKSDLALVCRTRNELRSDSAKDLHFGKATVIGHALVVEPTPSTPRHNLFGSNSLRRRPDETKAKIKMDLRLLQLLTK